MFFHNVVKATSTYDNWRPEIDYFKIVNCNECAAVEVSSSDSRSDVNRVLMAARTRLQWQENYVKLNRLIWKL